MPRKAKIKTAPSEPRPDWRRPDATAEELLVQAGILAEEVLAHVAYPLISLADPAMGLRIWERARRAQLESALSELAHRLKAHGTWLLFAWRLRAWMTERSLSDDQRGRALRIALVCEGVGRRILSPHKFGPLDVGHCLDSDEDPVRAIAVALSMFGTPGDNGKVHRSGPTGALQRSMYALSGARLHDHPADRVAGFERELARLQTFTPKLAPRTAEPEIRRALRSTHDHPAAQYVTAAASALAKPPAPAAPPLSASPRPRTELHQLSLCFGGGR